MCYTFLFLILLSLLLGAAFGPWAVFFYIPPVVAGHTSELYLREKLGWFASWLYIVMLFAVLVWTSMKLC